MIIRIGLSVRPIDSVGLGYNEKEKALRHAEALPLFSSLIIKCHSLWQCTQFQHFYPRNARAACVSSVSIGVLQVCILSKQLNRLFRHGMSTVASGKGSLHRMRTATHQMWTNIWFDRRYSLSNYASIFVCNITAMQSVARMSATAETCFTCLISTGWFYKIRGTQLPLRCLASHCPNVVFKFREMWTTENRWNRALLTWQKKQQNFAWLSSCHCCTDRAQNLPGPATDNVLRVLQIWSKWVHFRQSYSRKREHRQNTP